MLAARLRELVARVHELDPQVRERGSDSVHQMRLAVRRLRGTLASYYPAFDDDAIDTVRRELQWFGSTLGEVRDLEVMAQRVRELDHQAPALLAELEAEHERARERLAEAMASSRYAALLGRLATLADDPPFTAVAHLPASGLVRAQGLRDWRRIRGRVDTLPAPDDAAYEKHLHEVRKAAKRLKYLLETGREVTGAEARMLLRLLTSFQRRLGDHHDASLTGRLLTDAGQPSDEVEAEAAAVAKEFPALWRRLSAQKVLRWLH